MRWIRNWRVLAGIAVVAGLLAVALWPKQVEVDVATISRGGLQVTLDEEGQTRVRDRFVVSAPVMGRLQRIELEPGDTVVRGKTVLARLTPAQPGLIDARTTAELNAAVESAGAALGAARAGRNQSATALERAQSALRRHEALAKAGAISTDELEASQTAVKAADESLKAADFGVNRAEYDVQMTRARLQQPGPAGRTIEIVSPVDGVVLKRLHESEQVVPAGDALLEIGNPSAMEVVADFLSTDAVNIPAHARVLLEPTSGATPLEGRVRLVEPSGFTKVSALGVEEQRVNVIIDFVDPAAAARTLGDGYRVEVRIVTFEAGDLVKVPVGALFRRGESWALFGLEDGRAQTKLLELGERNATEARVLKGVEAGQEVILHPPDTLREGMRVRKRTIE